MLKLSNNMCINVVQISNYERLFSPPHCPKFLVTNCQPLTQMLFTCYNICHKYSSGNAMLTCFKFVEHPVYVRLLSHFSIVNSGIFRENTFFLEIHLLPS